MKAKVLKPFQEVGVKWIHRFQHRCLLADEMGLGKTVQVVQVIKDLPKIRPVIVICPAMAKWHWEAEIKDHAGLRSDILEGERPRKRIPIARAPIIIINYEILQYWLNYLRRLKPQMIVIDECHLCKSLKAIRTQSVQTLCLKVPKVITISGTPLVNRPAELYPILNILFPSRFKHWYKFAFRYCQPRRTRWGWEFKGATRLKQLHRILKEFTIRRLKRKVLPELPEMNIEVVPVELENAREYRIAEHDFQRWLRLRLGSRKAAKKSLKAEGLQKMGHLKRLAPQLKTKAMKSWIDSFLQNSGEKILVFAIHKAIIKELKEYYGDKCVVIDGSVTGRHRKQVVHEFNTNPKKKLCIANVQAGGTIWSARKCNTVLFVELPWTPGEVSQAAARVHGLGRGEGKRARWVYFMVARNTIETKLCKMLQEKQQILDAVLDGKKKTDLPDFDIHSRLMGEYARGKT